MIINRYLAREVYTTLVATIVVLLVIFLSNQFVRYMHLAAVGDLSSHAVMLLLMLQMPLLMAPLLPLSFFLAILLAYGRLYVDSEMTILTACGVSPWNLLKITLGFSTIIMLIVGALTFWINPKVYNYADHLISGKATSSIELLQPNRFDSISDRWVFYVNAATQDRKTLQGIFAADQPNQEASVVSAAGAYQKIDPATGDQYLVLTNGYRYTGIPGQKNYQIIKYDEYGVLLPQANTWQPDASSSSTWQLMMQASEPTKAAELHWRIALPLSTLILTLLATSLSRVKPRFGRYSQLVPAVLCYIVYVNFLFLAKAWMKKGILNPWLGMWWVHALMLILVIIIIGRQLGWRRFKQLYEYFR